MDGCVRNGSSIEEAEGMWGQIEHAGSWIFNKSHAVSYGMLSYYCAYMKAHYPIEFCCSILNNSKDTDANIRTLREFVVKDHIEYSAIDADYSKANWTIVNGILLGGFTNIKGIGDKKAVDILARRSGTQNYTPAMLRMLLNPVTPYDDLFPIRTKYGELFTKGQSHNIPYNCTKIEEIQDYEEHFFLGRLKRKNIRSLNEHNLIIERGGEALKEHYLKANIIIEDDTAEIMCLIGRFDFDRLEAQKIIDEGLVDESVYLVKGVQNKIFRAMQVEEIFNITDWSKDDN